MDTSEDMLLDPSDSSIYYSCL